MGAQQSELTRYLAGLPSPLRDRPSRRVKQGAQVAVAKPLDVELASADSF